MDLQSHLSIKDARDNFSLLIDTAALTGKSFTITKFGRPKAMITPVKSKISPKPASPNNILKEAKGIWADREDMKDSAAWVDRLRTEQSYR